MEPEATEGKVKLSFAATLSLVLYATPLQAWFTCPEQAAAG